MAVEVAGVAGSAQRWGGRPSGSAPFPSEIGPTEGGGRWGSGQGNRRGGRQAIGVVSALGDAPYGGKPAGWRGWAGSGETPKESLPESGDRWQKGLPSRTGQAGRRGVGGEAGRVSRE